MRIRKPDFQNYQCGGAEGEKEKYGRNKEKAVRSVAERRL